MELTFGEQIKIILKRKNMTIRQLAELMEVQTGKPMSRQNLTQKLNRDNFQEQDMKEIAQALGCVVKISVIDPVESAASPVQPPVVSQAVEPVRDQQPAGGRKEEEASHASGKHSAGRLRASRLAKAEAAVTRQPQPESGVEEGDVNADVLKEIELALMESVQKELYSEADTLAWARKKPLVWPTLTVPVMGTRQAEPVAEPGEDELLIDAGTVRDAQVPSDGGELEEELPIEEPLPEAETSSAKPSLEGELPPEEELSSEKDALQTVESVSETEISQEENLSELPFEEELFSELEDIPIEEEREEDLEDLEFFDLEDFYGEEFSQVSAPYAVKREEESPVGKEETSEKEMTPEAEADWESGSFDMIPEGNGDVSFASAPYVIPREPEKPADELMADEPPLFDGKAEEKEAEEEELRMPGSFSGSRGDISSVSAPYVIPREPEEAPPSKPMGERGYWQDVEEAEQEDWAALTPEGWNEEPEEEEEPLSPDMEEKIASWDAAVKRRLENPFLRSLERRARRAAEGSKKQTEQTDIKEEKEEKEEQTEEESRKEEVAEEVLDLRGPAINPLTGMEYETNTVKHHPTQPDMLLVYDQDEHRWIVQAERAFLNFQVNKRALLGKDYEPPLYLD